MGSALATLQPFRRALRGCAVRFWSRAGILGGVRPVSCLLLATQLVVVSAAAKDGESFEYLYIESNEGGSSGGHTAIRFGRDVYHFQHEDGLLVLNRDGDDAFFRSYALLGNRTIHSARVAVSQATRNGLVEHFRRRHRAQEAQIEFAQALRADRILLEQIQGRDRGPMEMATPPRLSVPGLGYFDTRQTPGGENRNPKDVPVSIVGETAVLRMLGRAIASEHGPNFLSMRRRDLLLEMEALAEEDPTAWQIERPASAYDHPPFVRSYAQRWRDLAARMAALDVLEKAPPLAEEAYHAPLEPEFEITRGEGLALERYAEELSGQLVTLVGSRRTDWGGTLLIGMARLSALDQSLETGRLVFLDTFPASARILDEGEVDRRRQETTSAIVENRRQLKVSRRYFTDSGDAREIAWERVEERGNRVLEILGAVYRNQPLRLASGHLVPSKSAEYIVPARISRSDAELAADLKASRRRERQYGKDLRRLHRYGLIGRNCATALFETIDDSLGGSILRSREELGGYIPSRGSLAFIPFVSAREVNARYSIVSREMIPSYRRRRLLEMRQEESSLRVAFRESNTFTSTAYEKGSEDSFFIFFTEENMLLRPVFGLVNLTAAVGQSVLGIVKAPIDRGETLYRGLRGAFVSLPELAFSNIRKGSNDWVPREHRVVDPIAE